MGCSSIEHFIAVSKQWAAEKMRLLDEERTKRGRPWRRWVSTSRKRRKQ